MNIQTDRMLLALICMQGRNQIFISGGGNFHEISFDDVIVLIQPRYNLFFRTFYTTLVNKNRTFYNSVGG